MLLQNTTNEAGETLVPPEIALSSDNLVSLASGVAAAFENLTTNASATFAATVEVAAVVLGASPLTTPPVHPPFHPSIKETDQPV